MPYLDYNQSNGYLLPPYLEELIPADHVARVVNRVPEVGDDKPGIGSYRRDKGKGGGQ